jgi:DNA-binding IclR family transcriptional regulator
MAESLSVRSAERTLAIFETFAKVKQELQLRELAAHCNMPVSSCHALVQTLVKRGYLYATIGRRKVIYPSRRLLALAETVGANDPFLVRMSVILEKLRDDCGETVIVGKRQNDAVLYIHVLQGPRNIRYTAQVGDYRPLHSTAVGKALLSVLSPAELQVWLATHPLNPLTGTTITDPVRLQEDVEEGRKRGYFGTRGENLENVTGLAVPVEMQPETLAVLVVGPAERMDQKFRDHAERLLQAKSALERLDAVPQLSPKGFSRT